REDREAGLRPFLICATAGSTMTGSIDPLDALADIAEAEDLWLHVDAAYGGFFMLTEYGRAAMQGISRAHSITLDPHKSLFIPYGTGALLVRNGEHLRAAHRGQGDRYSPRQDDDERIDFCEHSPELSRACRGLRVWLPLKVHGVNAFAESLQDKLNLAEWAAHHLSAQPNIDVPFAPSLTVVVFRHIETNLSADHLDEFNRRVVKRINDAGRIHLMGIQLNGRYYLRLCILSYRTDRNAVELALKEIKRGIVDVRASFEFETAPVL
ncbi:MAG: pyridoxal-dependent decarboxylase, partial [Myxococcota bacterium]